ncbi:transporter substrate-binding domain-containing protein [Zooshikella marina]|uniref:substrate-binding periplasmic protein n=1 Tax=Zooshikella ganghwensis TaxID=202772 RepID=UPI001BAEC671|nr:transporter substrate-binding domain-containing protein [Zooshikella ganghwensis]MBU2705661.1 transporter substrate-binding domain-containing protein [Zooshikella ganghwensis]
MLFCYKFIVIPTLCIFFFRITYCYTQDIKEVKVAVGEWPPYISKSLPHYGSLTQLVSKSFQAVDIEVTFLWLPWKRAFHMIKTGEIDATPGWSKNDERAKYSLFSESVVLTQYAHLFHRKDKPVHWQSLEDLIKYRFVGFIGYNYNYLEDVGVNIYYVKNEKQALNMILTMRADVFEANLTVGQKVIDKYLNSEQKSLFTFSKKPIKQFNYHVLFPQTTRGEQVKRLFDKGFNLTSKSPANAN